MKDLTNWETFVTITTPCWRYSLGRNTQKQGVVCFPICIELIDKLHTYRTLCHRFWCEAWICVYEFIGLIISISTTYRSINLLSEKDVDLKNHVYLRIVFMSDSIFNIRCMENRIWWCFWNIFASRLARFCQGLGTALPGGWQNFAKGVAKLCQGTARMLAI